MFVHSICIFNTDIYDPKDRYWKAKYLIVDSDFEEKITGISTAVIGPEDWYNTASSFSTDEGAGYAIIKCYQEKNLNVAKNFVKFLKFSATRNNKPIIEELSYQKKYNLLFGIVEKDLEKYIHLI